MHLQDTWRRKNINQISEESEILLLFYYKVSFEIF